MGEVSRIERYTWEIPIRVEWFGLGGSYYLVQFVYGCSVLSGVHIPENKSLRF